MIRKEFWFLVLILSTVNTITAQLNDAFIYGKLIDNENQQPIVFATVRIKDKAIGVISNHDGGFSIPQEFEFEGESLVISSMGYETKEVLFSSLNDNKINLIYLKPSIIQLKEAIVVAKKKSELGKVKGSLSPEKIVAMAINNIKYNYDNNPFELVGYYRDYQLRKKEYTNLNESIIRVFDKGFHVQDYKSLQFGLYNYKPNLSFPIDTFAAKPYDYKKNDKFIPDAVLSKRVIPNELALLFIHDAIRNNNDRTFSYVYSFVQDFLKEHNFNKYSLTNFGATAIYKVNFSKNSSPFQVKGTIYIDKNTFAIRKMEYAVFKEKNDNSVLDRDIENDKKLLYEIIVEYRKVKGSMYLNYISFHNKFKLIRPPEFFIKETILDPNTKQMTLVLNKPANNWLEVEPRHFKIYYKKKRLKVKKVERTGEIGDTYVVSFSKKEKNQRQRLIQLFSNIEDTTKQTLAFVIKKMTDAKGNLIAERKTEIIDQFREFFTQEVVSEVKKEPVTNLFLDKSKSLGNSNQPKLHLNFKQEYWMNTPLKKSPNK